ncbi:prephenate dehydrogenase/arogenate dehydrogenase family protein [Parasphingopyxis algicola]|uniref:prephenate dehydrogenase n=1 Tax=Parasphingopyxis algicola TaxID=2026624 RepID=UPI0015A2EFD2|nr:prephenate dehydrogenase/arogenate dehydrogenase family protein [Parasphingopyxis algicola]QLC25272.1 prephenate dehydrogenase/arogenate dehydrogenase family protein [Parasphingopyxis algicola]
MSGIDFQKFGLVGAGLVGGSIAARLARALPDTVLLVHDASPGNAAYVAERHPRSERVGTIAPLAGCDAIFVATPVATIAEQVVTLLQLPNSDALIIDTGSAKQAIVAAVATSGADAGRFVPGHPLAGGISAGPGRASGDIVTARPFVLTPTESTGAEALAHAKILLERLGAEVVEMTPDAHDRLLALGSHLPHLIAYALAGLGTDEPGDLLPASYRGIAAFAGSDAQMWSDIFRANSAELKAAMEEFKKRLDLIAAMADEPVPGVLLETLTDAKARIDALENEE